jgi:hypothetical protein
MVNLPTTRMANQITALMAISRTTATANLEPSGLTGDQLESIKDSDQIRRLREVVV